MNPNDGATLIAGVLVSIAVLWVALEARRIWNEDRWPCWCGCPKNHHVSAWDWDSNYGNPQHVGPDYRKPGTCRDCKCIGYHAARRAS